MTSRLSILLCLSMLYYCKQPAPKPNPIKEEGFDCRQMIQYFKKSWIQHESGYYGFSGDSIEMRKMRTIFNRKSGKKCFNGMNKKALYKLLGEPSRISPAGDDTIMLEYFFNKYCEKNESGCARLKIMLSTRDNTVVDVLPIITETVYY